MDEIEIANLVYRCAEHVDSGDLDAAAALFRDARVQLGKDSKPVSHVELLAFWQEDMIVYPDGTPRTRHVITNPIVHVDQSGGTATCRSCYTVMQASDALPLQVIASGRYHDEFEKSGGSWRFSFRDFSLVDATGDMRHHSRAHAKETEAIQPAPYKNGPLSPTKAKILAAAQQVFSTVGYSEAGIRKIAEIVGLSPTILFRHFNTKAALFEEALIAALGEPKLPMNRERHGQDIADMLADTDHHICPHAMTVLATGNEEARQIATKVLQEYALTPMAKWLGPPNAESRARQMLALCAGFTLYYSRFKTTTPEDRDPHMVEWLAKSIQAVVDQT